MHKKVDLW